MKITTVLFDLDGTLLPIPDQSVFVKFYFGSLSKKLANFGYEPKSLVNAVWAGIDSMIKNDGTKTNEEAFWNCFCGLVGGKKASHKKLFEDYYKNEFIEAKNACGFNPQSLEVVRKIKEMGLKVVLATNPIFPRIATEKRIKWAGLSPDLFEIVTTYENSTFCKPNLEYYKEIISKLGVKPEECLMVGNDVSEDMVAKKLNINVFLTPECLLNKDNADISAYPQGKLNDVIEYIKNLK